MRKELILALDVGSSSVRGALYDSRGQMLRQTFVSLMRPLTKTREGGSEIDSAASVRQVVKVIDDVLEKAPAGDVTSIVSCTFWHSLVGFDNGGHTTTPIFGWADNQSRNQVARLKKRFHENRFHNRTGTHFHSSYWPAKLLWLKAEHNETWRRTAQWCSIGDLLQREFTGKADTDLSIASGTGLFDIRKGLWDRELLRFLKLKSGMLPSIAVEGAAFALLPKWKRRWPRLSGALWKPSVADGFANSIGSGCERSDRTALMLGTSGAMRVVINGEPPKRIPDGLWCYRVGRKRVIFGGAISDGGGLYNWLKKNLRLDLSDTSLTKEIARRGPTSHALSFIPHFAGERSLGYDEFATGSISGLTMAHDALDIMQAAMEAVGYRFAEILERIERICPVKEIVASGGALSASPIWAHIIADVLGRDLTVSRESEASLRGAVLLELEKTGKIVLADKTTAKQDIKISYRPEYHSAYQAARTREYRNIKHLRYRDK